MTDTDMELLAGFTGLEKLELGINTLITDEGLKHLKGLGKLRILSIALCPKLTGASFADLAGFDQVVMLNISHNEIISDDNLTHLQELESLQILTASSMRGATDEGLKHLSKSSDLRSLRFKSELVTDQGLDYLAELKNLETLNLTGCSQLTDVGIKKLQQALPDCTIVK